MKRLSLPGPTMTSLSLWNPATIGSAIRPTQAARKVVGGEPSGIFSRLGSDRSDSPLTFSAHFKRFCYR